MLGIYCDTFNGNQVTLMVQYFDENQLTEEELQEVQNNSTYYFADSISSAIEHFDIYFENGGMYKHTNEETAIKELGISASEAEDFREKINSIIQNFDDETALENAVLYPNWAENKNYAVNDKVRYNNKLYKVLQAHTSTSTWTPDAAMSLFAQILTGETPDEILDWVQPGSTNAYMTGDRVRFNGHIYESVIDNNIWSPAVYAPGWTLIE